MKNFQIWRSVQATAAIDRIINYEEVPPNTAGFYRNVMISALFEDTNAFPQDGLEDGTEDRPWIENVEDIRNFLVNQGYQVDRIYTTSSGWPADPNSDQPGNYQNGTALPAAITPPAFGWNGTRNDVVNWINAGRFLVTYRDHGGRDSWSATGFDNGDAAGLTNGNQSPVIFSIACQTGWFDNETDDATLNTANNDESFCEHFLRNTNGGAVAIIGSTRNSWRGAGQGQVMPERASERHGRFPGQTGLTRFSTAAMNRTICAPPSSIMRFDIRLYMTSDAFNEKGNYDYRGNNEDEIGNKRCQRVFSSLFYRSFLMILSSIDMYTPIRLKSNKILLVDIKEWQAARKLIFEDGFLYNLYLW